MFVTLPPVIERDAGCGPTARDRNDRSNAKLSALEGAMVSELGRRIRPQALLIEFSSVQFSSVQFSSVQFMGSEPLTSQAYLLNIF